MTETNTQAGLITGRYVLDVHLEELMALDPRLGALCENVGDVPLRLEQGGFAGMARIVNGQLLSVQSARAIFARLAALPGALVASQFLDLSEEDLRGAGLSGAKISTLRGLAQAEIDGEIDYDRVAGLSAEDALAALMAHKGVGRWTAEIYLLFCTGHPDIFPAGDLALRKMVGHVTSNKDMPSIALTGQKALAWSPYRGAAARLLWHGYANMNTKDGGGI